MQFVDAKIEIPDSEFEFSFARSGGPGGQNVNKVNSKVFMRWPIAISQSVNYAVKGRLIDKFANRLNDEGVLVLSSQKFRDQKRNIDDCLAKLDEMLAAVINQPKLRTATRPTLASKERRITGKLINKAKKQSRQGRIDFD